MAENKTPLVAMTLDELKNAAKELGMPAFTGAQMAKWLYGKGVRDIDEMTNLSKANREKLKAHYEVGGMDPIDCQKSVDGTIKYLFPTASGKFVETVYIPDGDRATLCVSSQVGCKMNCLFCQTGKQGFEGNLTAADILNQIYSLPEREKLTNVVFMGQGEPMDNLDNVLRVTQVLTADYGFAWSPKRITVSSVGVKNKLKRFLDESDCHVAISMHSPIPEQRAMLMPAEKGMSIKDVVALMHQYDFTHQRRLSFEYIVFGGLNDSMLHAREIVKLVEGLECRVNLIRYPREIVSAFAKTFPGVVIVDEAYVDFADDSCMELATARDNTNVIVMRTLSKSFSLAGLRLGYCVGPEDLIEALYKVKDSYNVDALAQDVALAALSDLPWMRANAAKVCKTREETADALGRRGWDVPKSQSNFLFARPAHRPAAEIFEQLRRRNIFVRYFPGPNTGDRLRITIGTDADMTSLLNALKELDK